MKLRMEELGRVREELSTAKTEQQEQREVVRSLKNERIGICQVWRWSDSWSACAMHSAQRTPCNERISSQNTKSHFMRHAFCPAHPEYDGLPRILERAHRASASLESCSTELQLT